MKFKVLRNPRRKRRSSARRRKFSPKQLAAQRKFAAMARKGSFKRKARRARRSTKPAPIMAKRSRKSRARRVSHKRRRRSNPILAVANPRRRSRSGRRLVSRRRSRRSNPRFVSGSSFELLKDALGVGAGWIAASTARRVVGNVLGLIGTSEKIGNVAVKFGTGIVGMMILRKVGMGRYSRPFATGAFTSGVFDIIAIATGKPMSVAEYVTPRTMKLSRGGGLRLGSVPGITPIQTARLAAYPKAYPKAF